MYPVEPSPPPFQAASARQRPLVLHIVQWPSMRPWRSPLVSLILRAYVLVFAAIMFANNCPVHSNPYGECVGDSLGRFAFQPLEQIPDYGPSHKTLLRLGALQFDKVVYRLQVWRIATSMWLHSSVFHLISNMIGLVLYGPPLEFHLGSVQFGVIYLFSGLGAGITVFFHAEGIITGASGALCGLYGVILWDMITNWTTFINKVAALFALLFPFMLNLPIGNGGDFYGHFGGFIAGLLISFKLLTPHSSVQMVEFGTVPS